MPQEILIEESDLLINFKDGSLSIQLSADELKNKLSQVSSSEDEEEGKKPIKKAATKK